MFTNDTTVEDQQPKIVDKRPVSGDELFGAEPSTEEEEGGSRLFNDLMGSKNDNEIDAEVEIPKKEAPEKEEETAKEEKPESVLAKLEGQDREDKALELLDKEKLTADEVDFMKIEGYEVESEEDIEEEAGDKKEEAEKKEETPIVNERRDSILDRIDPSKSYENEEERNEALYQFTEKSIEGNEDILTALENSPDLGKLVVAAKKGGAAYISAAKEFAENILIIPESGDDGYEEYVERNIKAKIAHKEKEKELIKAQETKSKAAIKVKAWVEKKGFSEDEAQERLQEFDNLINDVYSTMDGAIEILDMMDKIRNMDNTINEATKKAELKGKNEAVKKIVFKKKGDGVPSLSSGESIQNRQKNNDADLLMLDRNANQKNTNW